MNPAQPSELLPLFAMALALTIATLMWLWQSDWGQSAEVFFGVRVPKGFEDSLEAMPIRLRYDHTVKLIPVVLFAVYALILHWVPLPRVPDHHAALVLDGVLLLQAIGVRATFWRARNETLPYAASVETPHAASLSELKGPSRTWRILYWCAVLAPLVFVAWSTVFVWTHWLASHFPIDTNLKLPLTIDSPPIFWRRQEVYRSMRWVIDTLLVNLDAILVAFAFNYRSRFNEWGEEEPERQSYRKQLMVFAVVMQWILTAKSLMATLELGFFRPDFRNSNAMTHIVWIAVVGFVVTYGIPLWLLNRLYDNRPPGYVNRGGNEHWKLGLYYINRGDSAAVVPTRFGVGETLNLGHPLAWAIVLVSLISVTNRFIFVVHPVQAAPLPANSSELSEEDKTAFVMESEALSHREFAAADRLRQLHTTYNADLWSSTAFLFALNRVKQNSALHQAESAVSMTEWQIVREDPGLPADAVRLDMEHLAAIWSNMGFVCLRHKRKDVVCAVPYLSAAEALDPHASYAGLLAEAEQKHGVLVSAAVPSQTIISGAAPIEIAGLQAPRGTTLLNLVFKSDGDTAIHVEEGTALDSRDTATLNKTLRFPWPDGSRDQVIVRASLSCAEATKPCMLTILRAR